MDEREIEMQAIQFIDGALLKGTPFETWARSKDFNRNDRIDIREKVAGIIMDRAYEYAKQNGG